MRSANRVDAPGVDFPGERSNTQNMKFWLTAFLMTGFLSLAVFGALGMGDHGSHAAHGCVAAVAQSADCPPAANGLDSAAFHLDALKDFSTAVFGADAAILAFLAALFAMLLIDTVFLRNLRLPILVSTESRVVQNPWLIRRETHRWLAILQRRDPSGS